MQPTKMMASLGRFTPPSTLYNEGSDSNEGAIANLEYFISTVIGVITIVAALFFVVNFLIAAISWISAGGDASKVSSARDKMIQSTLGLVVVVAAYGIMGIIGAIVGIDVLKPGEMLINLIPV